MKLDAWNADQPRDERGRWGVSGAITASREATAQSGVASMFGGAEDHRVAATAHEHASKEARSLGEKHLELGNHAAAERFAALYEHHAANAASHTAEANKLDPPKAPKPTKVPVERKPVDPRRAAGARKAAETRGQNDDFAKQNIPDHLHPLWDRMKTTLKGTPHERAEKLVEYAEENPHEAIDASMASSEKKLAGMIRAHVGGRRRVA